MSLLAEKYFNVSSQKLIDFLSNPMNLKHWTIHRNIYLMGEDCVEAINRGENWILQHISIRLTTEDQDEKLVFKWTENDYLVKEFHIKLKAIGSNKTLLQMLNPKELNLSRQENLSQLLQIELRILEKVVLGREYNFKKQEIIFIQNYIKNAH